MSENRYPKKLLFSWLSQKRPAHGTKLHWWDKVHQDLKKCGIDETSQYKEAQDRTRWRSLCTYGLDKHVMAPLLNKPFICATCHLSFRRTQDIARHKCTTTHPHRHARTHTHYTHTLHTHTHTNDIVLLHSYSRAKSTKEMDQ